MRRVKKNVVSFDKYFAAWDALDKVIEAWEVLPGGQRHSAMVVEQWLGNTMTPAINNARRAMGRRVPDVT